MSLTEKIQEVEGDLMTAIEQAMFDGVSPGYCTDPDCIGTIDRLEPDAYECECPECGCNSVYSLPALMMMGLI